jgi:protein-S-isoprenylcysteine O-methyltransferase Ste14
MDFLNQYGYGLWTAVLVNILLFGLFAYLAFRPTTKRDWRTLGIFYAFIVALFTEMFGFPLTIYFLTSALGKKYPALDPFTHFNGHLWIALTGGSKGVYYVLHPLSNILIFAGLVIISIGWKKIYSDNSHLVTDGIYKYVRHPQYSGFILTIIGFLLQWPTIITLLMAPILLVIYIKLAKKEEKILIDVFKDQYLEYKKKVPAFMPRIKLF